MRTVGSSTLRGGQTVFHGLRMWGQLLRAGFFLAAFSIVAAPAWFVWQRTTGYEWYAAAMVTVAEAKLALGYQRTSRQEVRQPDGRVVVLAIPDIAASPRPRAMRERLKEEVFAGAVLGAKASVAAIALFLALFWIRGRQLQARRRIRGAELATVGQLRRRIRPLHRRALDLVSATGKHPPYTIAGVPYPKRAETQHTIVSGTTGSGKTVLISDLVEQIRKRGERCVVYDKMGSYTRSFFDPERDVLLNPLDARSPRWSPFFEARSPRDFDTMAAALIPQQKDTVDPFWVTAARQLFANGAGRAPREGGEREPHPGRASAQDRPHRARRSDGGHRRAIHSRPREPQDGAQRARHAHRQYRRAGVAARYRDALLDPRLGRRRGARRLPVPDLARRPACEPARPHLDLARDRGQRHAVPGAGRRAPHLGRPRRAPHPPPGALRSSPGWPRAASSAAASSSASR